MKTSSLLWVLLAVVPLSFAGCGKDVIIPTHPAPTVEPGIGDWEAAAQYLSKGLIDSGRIVVPPGKTVVIGVGLFKNSTTNVDLQSQLLFNKVCATITSDKIQTMAYDPVAVAAARAPALSAWEAADKEAVLRGTPRPPRPAFGPEPDYTLDGEITRVKGSAGRTQVLTYDFHMRLNDTRTGLTPWQDSTNVTKQWTRPGIGG